MRITRKRYNEDRFRRKSEAKETKRTTCYEKLNITPKAAEL
ncbi:hypothetical protein [Clostridium vincentii]|nr:hypothetical protein [Clostridium vincentii]